MTVQISSFILGVGLAMTGVSLAQQWTFENGLTLTPMILFTLVIVFAVARSVEWTAAND